MATRLGRWLLMILFILPLLMRAPKAGAVITTVTAPFMRADNALNHMRLDPKGRFVAYIGDNGLGLNVLDMKTKSIYRVSEAQIGASFVWSPDGFRLFYREEAKQEGGGVASKLKAFDCLLTNSVTFDEMPYATGFLTFDPRDLRLHMLSPLGIRTKRISFPGERLARWQVAQRNETGKFLAVQHGVLWVTQGGFAMRRLEDDKTDLESFDISPDGHTIAWATASGRVYLSQDGKAPLMIGRGRDPRFHPERPLLVYAGARTVGDTIIGYDIRLSDLKGRGRFLTSSQFSDERWPQFHPKGNQIIYTIAKTTDLFILDFKQ